MTAAVPQLHRLEEVSVTPLLWVAVQTGISRTLPSPRASTVQYGIVAVVGLTDVLPQLQISAAAPLLVLPSDLAAVQTGTGKTIPVPSALTTQYLYVEVVGFTSAVPQLHGLEEVSATPTLWAAVQTGFGKTIP